MLSTVNKWLRRGARVNFKRRRSLLWPRKFSNSLKRCLNASRRRTHAAQQSPRCAWRFQRSSAYFRYCHRTYFWTKNDRKWHLITLCVVCRLFLSSMYGIFCLGTGRSDWIFSFKRCVAKLLIWVSDLKRTRRSRAANFKRDCVSFSPVTGNLTSLSNRLLLSSSTSPLVCWLDTGRHTQ